MEKLIIIKTISDLKALIEYVKDKDYIAYDTETTGVKKSSEIIGLSICAEVEVGYYVVTAYWDPIENNLIYLETKDFIKELLKVLLTKNLIMHNAIFDCQMTASNFGVQLMPSVHTDTLMLGHLLDENRSNGLKELGASFYGEDAREEQRLMKESVIKNGGELTKANYELYKGDVDLIAKYGAKDAILTLKLFYDLVPTLYEQELDQFFYEDETMPLLKGPTYDLNTTGLQIDPVKLKDLKGSLEVECLESVAFIHNEIKDMVKDRFKGTKSSTFNIKAPKQLSWLMFFKLGNLFNTLTKEGRNLCHALSIKLPYSDVAKREFIRVVESNKDRVWEEAKYNPKTKKMTRPKKVGDPWNYIACDKATLGKLASKYKFVEKLLKYAKDYKLLNTYVQGIQDRMEYNVIRPSFLQHGTTSGRYSCKNPNFQNLPRKDKRVKSCIVARKGMVFVGADYSQLEPRVFASFSKDERLLNCFKTGDDFYSVIGAEVFGKVGYSLKKDDPDSFAKKFESLRDIAKVVALSSTYGTTAPKMAVAINKDTRVAQEIIDNYFESFPNVLELMKESHQMAMNSGEVKNLFGRPRRIPKAKLIKKLFGEVEHNKLEYEFRNLLNLAINHRIQSTGASIMNRAAIAMYKRIRENEVMDARWHKVKIVLQIHDQLILEGPEELGENMVIILKDCMENTVTLPGVGLIAEPTISVDMSDQK